VTKDEMALEDFIVDITGKVAQNIEEIQHLFKVNNGDFSVSKAVLISEVFCMAVTFFLSSAVANLSG
jgi:hypothetical protein